MYQIISLRNYQNACLIVIISYKKLRQHLGCYNLEIHSIGVLLRFFISPLPQGLCLTSKNEGYEIKYIRNKIITHDINSNKNESNLHICLT